MVLSAVAGLCLIEANPPCSYAFSGIATWEDLGLERLERHAFDGELAWQEKGAWVAEDDHTRYFIFFMLLGLARLTQSLMSSSAARARLLGNRWLLLYCCPALLFSDDTGRPDLPYILLSFTAHGLNDADYPFPILARQ
jgi:hypothetical protein